MAAFSIGSARLVAAAEALLSLEIIHGQKQREQFVLTRFKGRRDDTTYVAMQFDDVQKHFDALMIGGASHLLELEAACFLSWLTATGFQPSSLSGTLMSTQSSSPTLLSPRKHTLDRSYFS